VVADLDDACGLGGCCNPKRGMQAGASICQSLIARRCEPKMPCCFAIHNENGI
jgi:hypothetical protein